MSLTTIKWKHVKYIVLLSSLVEEWTSKMVWPVQRASEINIGRQFKKEILG